MGNPPASSGVRLNHLLWCAGGLLAGAWWVKNQTDEAKKSRAEQDDLDGTATICKEVAPILDRWEPQQYDCEDDYADDLYQFLCDDYIDDPDSSAEDIDLRPDTCEGVPDILIDDRLVLELKLNPNKAERDRLVGQCAGYSREWVTWVVLIDTPSHRVRELEELLAAKGLEQILVFAFS
jgi:hypothetical protein